MTTQAPITLFVPGNPAPGGSKKNIAAVGRRAIIVDDAKRNTPWRAKVRKACRDYMSRTGTKIIHGAVRLDMVFRLPRPKYHFEKEGLLKPKYRDTPHTKKPDRTKLGRAAEDAMTGVVWVDDAQVICGDVSKEYADPGKEGVYIGVTPIV